MSLFIVFHQRNETSPFLLQLTIQRGSEGTIMQSQETQNINDFINDAKCDFELSRLQKYAEENDLTLEEVEDRAPSWKETLFQEHRLAWRKAVFNGAVEQFGRDALFRTMRQASLSDPVLMVRPLLKHTPPEGLFPYSKDSDIYDVIKVAPFTAIDFLDSTVIPSLFGIYTACGSDKEALDDALIADVRSALWSFNKCTSVQMDAIHAFLTSPATEVVPHTSLYKFKVEQHYIDALIILKNCMTILDEFYISVLETKAKIDNVSRHVLTSTGRHYVVPNIQSAKSVKDTLALINALLAQKEKLGMVIPAVAAVVSNRLHSSMNIQSYNRQLGDFLECLIYDTGVDDLVKIEVLRSFGFFDNFRDLLPD